MKFKKIMSVLASAIMLSSTIGFAAAASYPAPFVVGGTASSAVVVGANAAVSDWSAAIDVQENLQGLVTSKTSSSSASFSGEAVQLDSGGTKIYVNDSLNKVKTVLTKSDLPTVLKDTSFSGIVDASMTQTIDLGAKPRVTFKKQPTSSDDPAFALETSTSSANFIYNATVTFNKAVDFNNASSEGESIDIMGQSFTVASATDGTNLVLLQSAEKVSLDSDNPSADVTIGGEVYTVELISASDTAATIKVTDSSGASSSKEVNEAASKKIQGITVAVTNADETNLKLSASIVAGSEKITMTSGSQVTSGEDDKAIDGAYAYFTGGTTAMTKLVISVVAADSDHDAIKAGESLTDPVYKSFKLDFAGLNIPEDSTTARATISFDNSGDDKMQISMTEHRGNEKTFVFAKNLTTSFELISDDDNRNISVIEMDVIRYQDLVVVGNEDEGYLLKLTSVANGTTGTTNDRAKFTDVFSGDVLETTWTSDGTGTLTVGGKSFGVTMRGNSNNASEEYAVRLNYPDSSGADDAVVYSTIQTSKGALIGFYEPLLINISNWDNTASNLTKLRFPDGDGYTDTDILGEAAADSYNFTTGTSAFSIATNATANTNSSTITIGRLTYNVTSTAKKGQIKLMLRDVSGVNIDQPGVIIFEEKDNNVLYEALIVKLENGATSDDGIGIDDIERTWGSDSSLWETTMPGDSKIQKDADLWGTIITTDSSDSDQKSATISYPDEQIYAQLFIGEVASVITPGTTTSGAGGQILIVKDSEISSVSGKNLIVVGGSCINTAAAKILGSETPLCTSAWTEKTGVSAGQYIIKTVASPFATADSGKVAMLVAGYEAADTANAVTKALEGVTSDVDTSQVYPITTTTTA